MNYRLLRANNALSRLAQNGVFVRMQDALPGASSASTSCYSAWRRRNRASSRNTGAASMLLEARLRHHDLRVRTGTMRRQLEARTAQLNTAMSRLLLARRTRRLESAVDRIGARGASAAAAPARALGAAAQQSRSAVAEGDPRPRIRARLRCRWPSGEAGVSARTRRAGPHPARGRRVHGQSGEGEAWGIGIGGWGLGLRAMTSQLGEELSLSLTGSPYDPICDPLAPSPWPLIAAHYPQLSPLSTALE